MEDAALGNPSLQERAKSLPPHLCSLAAPDENTSPQPVNTMLKDAQLSRVTRDSMVLVVAQHKLAKGMHRRRPSDDASGVEVQP